MKDSKEYEPSGRFAVADAHGIFHRSGYWRWLAGAGVPDQADLLGAGIRQLWWADRVPPPAVPAPIRVIQPSQSAELTMWDLRAAELYSELCRFESATGELFVSSPAITSDVILRHLHQGPSTRPIRKTTEPAIARRAGGRPPEAAEGDLLWWADPIEQLGGEMPGGGGTRYVHHFDLNASYLGAAGQLRLPQGEPHYVGGPFTWLPVDKSKPGYWLVELPLPAGPAGWPPIARNRSMRAGRAGLPDRAWLTTPTVELAASLGPVRVLHGWYWRDTSNALRPWVELLRDARAELKSGPAFEAIKRIYKAGIGRLGSTRRSDPDDPLYQPTWRHLVIAEARGRVWRRIAKAPYPPIAVQVDGAWWLSDRRDPYEAADELGLPMDPIKLGHWKVAGTAAGPRAVAALGSRTPIPALRELTIG